MEMCRVTKSALGLRFSWFSMEPLIRDDDTPLWLGPISDPEIPNE
jgi:hypothetical protein